MDVTLFINWKLFLHAKQVSKLVTCLKHVIHDNRRVAELLWVEQGYTVLSLEVDSTHISVVHTMWFLSWNQINSHFLSWLNWRSMDTYNVVGSWTLQLTWLIWCLNLFLWCKISILGYFNYLFKLIQLMFLIYPYNVIALLKFLFINLHKYII